jgi:hypothetical protein
MAATFEKIRLTALSMDNVGLRLPPDLCIAN